MKNLPDIRNIKEVPILVTFTGKLFNDSPTSLTLIIGTESEEYYTFSKGKYFTTKDNLIRGEFYTLYATANGIYLNPKVIDRALYPRYSSANFIRGKIKELIEHKEGTIIVLDNEIRILNPNNNFTLEGFDLTGETEYGFKVILGKITSDRTYEKDGKAFYYRDKIFFLTEKTERSN